MGLSKIGLDQWSRYIKLKTWIFEDTCSTIASNNLLLLLNDIFPKKFQAKKLGFEKNHLPIGFHFLYNNQPNVTLGSDGYDNYQAPMIRNKQAYRRRMWVKGNIEFYKSPLLNEYLKCTEHVHTVKTFGDATFVNIIREFSNAQCLNFVENRTLIYKNDLYHPVTNQASFPKFNDTLNIQLSSNDIIRYSYLTYNCHKIHYDGNYCRKKENLPEIIVQGPFMVTLLLYWFQKLHPDFMIKKFTYKNIEPWFLNDRVTLGCVEGEDSYKLQIINEENGKVYIEGMIR
ncbi:unnamed protein product [Debaryomyces tyrocola]|nr:unnamed protein product [Debaryomyces tyrocola]